MNFEEYLNETLEEGRVSKTLGAISILASTIFAGPMAKIYDKVGNENKELVATTAALVNAAGSGQAVVSSFVKMRKKIQDEGAREILLDYGSKLASKQAPDKPENGGVKSSFVIQIGQDAEKVKAQALSLLQKVKDNGIEDMEELGDIVVEEIKVGGDGMFSSSDVWFIAYPEGADKTYLLQQKVRAL